MNTTDILVRARKLIDHPRHWGQGMSEKRPGTYCAHEAIIAAADGVPFDAVRAFSNSLDEPNIVRWNDDKKRTHAEVLAAFDRAIEASKSEGK
jgi:hypothetical protein